VAAGDLDGQLDGRAQRAVDAGADGQAEVGRRRVDAGVGRGPWITADLGRWYRRGRAIWKARSSR